MKYCEICGKASRESRIYNYKDKALCNRHYQQLKDKGSINITRYDKNEISIKDNYAEIYLYDFQGKYKDKAIIDREDVPKVLNHKWHLENTGYAGTDINGKRVLLHRIILNAANGVIDHINRNPLDNRKINLRECTQEQNCYNLSVKSNNSSGVTGVNYSNRERKWRAYITANKKTKHLGWFETKEEAVMKRKEAEKEYFGEFAPVNKEERYV